MTNFRAKAAEIKAAGAAERGNFEPHGVPKRIYSYWLHNSNSDRAEDILDGRRRENFCHFWRVVAIWAPLMFAFNKVDDFASRRSGKVTLAVLVLAVLALGASVSDGFLNFVIGLSIGAALGGTLLGIGFGIHWLIKHYWNSEWNRTAEKVALSSFAVLGGGLMIFLLVALVISEGWLALLGVFGIVLGAAVLVFGFGALAEYIAGRRSLKREAERERVAKMTDEEYVSYREAQLKTREPGKVAKFFSGVGDFLVLAAQVVRVKKWKICPMVSIND